MAENSKNKMTEIGNLPSDWDVMSLSEIGRFSKGSGVTRDQSHSGDIPCVRYGELYTTHDNYIRSFSSFISAEVAKTATKLSKGDILFAGSGETKEEIGLTLTPEELHFVCEYATDEKLISVYLTDRTGKNDEFVLDKEEVESVEWIELADLDMFIRARVKPPLRELLPHIPVLRYYIENYL